MNIIDYLHDSKIPFEQNVDLKRKTWIHRGGVAELFITPDNISQLEAVVAFLYNENRDFLVIGHTSNLYIHNDHNPAIVISTIHCNKYTIEGEYIHCECGTSVRKLAADCVSKGLKGLEYLTTLPGTVAAAIYNNSSCRDNSIASVVEDICYISPIGGGNTLCHNELGFTFRSSSFKRHELKGVILSVKLKLSQGNKNELLDISRNNEIERKKILEGPCQNLGCTVNRCFINGPMPKRYAIPLTIYGKILSFFNLSIDRNKELKKNFILRISGYSQLIPYISNKQMIIFVWKDEGADAAYPKYLEFMRKVYKTDKVEIEEITNG